MKSSVLLFTLCPALCRAHRVQGLEDYPYTGGELQR